ncbi:MAG: HlyD family efflux transporter periplasmic adaptor subunit [Myxococcota bacterium]
MIRARFVWLPSLAMLAACGSDPADLPAVGTLERDRIELVAEANEPIVAIRVREGDSVVEGQVLLQLDDALLAAQRARGEAARDELRARLAESERGPRAERIREARARLARADSAVRNAQTDFARARALEQRAFESQARSDLLRARRDEAIARRDEYRAALEALERGSTSEELDQARGALAAAEAQVAEIGIRRARLEVRAPRAGRVDALPFERGERPPAGAVVAILLSSDPAYARVYVPEPLRARIASGSRARVQIAGLEGEFAGTVRMLSHEAAFTPYYALTQYDRGRLSYLAEIEIDGPAGRELPTGVPVEVRFELDALAEAGSAPEPK